MEATRGGATIISQAHQMNSADGQLGGWRGNQRESVEKDFHFDKKSPSSSSSAPSPQFITKEVVILRSLILLLPLFSLFLILLFYPRESISIFP